MMSRFFHPACLIVVLCLQVSALPAWTQSESEEDWPDDIEGRPYNSAPAYMQKTNNPILKRLEQMEAADNPAKKLPDKSQKPIEEKKGIWPFKKKQKIKPLSEKQITDVGPRETQPVKDPLLALPVSLQSETGQVLPAGFYLVRQHPQTGPDRTWQLIKENKILMSCQAHQSSQSGTNINSPLTSTEPDKNSALSPVFKVIFSATSANAPKVAKLVLQEGGQRFESDTFSVLEDKRPAIRND